MKRIAALLCALLVCTVGFTGCGNPASGFGTAGKIKVVCTVFPQYDWVRQILGEHIGQFDVKLLADNGVDMHSYQPSTADIAAIASCDVLIYTGGASDVWVENALKEAVNPNMTVINLMEVLGDTVKEEELVEGMQEEDEHEHTDETGGSRQGSEEIEYDEHIWLSVKNAERIVEELTRVLAEKDTQNAQAIKQNSAAYADSLKTLDMQYQEMVQSAKRDTVLFGDRFPFRYLIDDYGIKYYAAFAGCSSETNASFETVVFLAGKVDELGLDSVLVIENSGEQVAKTVIENTKNKNAAILILDSMQSVTAKDMEQGYTYLSAMQKNLEVFRTALN